MRAIAFVAFLILSAESPSGQAPAQPPVKKAEPTAAISGIVVDGTSGEPIENASVIISGTGTGGMMQPRQFTDAKGRFVFVNLAAGLDYMLSALAPGYFSGSFSRDSGPSDQRSSIPLKADEWVHDVRVTVWKPGSISGRVIDETGEPMVGVFVRALSRVSIAGRDQLVPGPLAITDDRGMYRIAGLTVGRYVVEVPSVQAPFAAPTASSVSSAGQYTGINGRYPWSPPPGLDGRARGYPISFYPGARSISDAGSVDVRLTEERGGIDVMLEPVPLFKVAGTIHGPVEGLSLRLVPAGLESLGNGGEAAATFIGADGAFSFAGVPVGSYMLDVRRRIPEFANSLMTQPRRLPAPPAPAGPSGSSMSSMSVQAAPPGISLSEVQYGLNTSTSATQAPQARQALSVSAADIEGVVVTLRSGAVMDGTIDFDVAPEKPDARPAPFAMGLSLDPASGQPELGVPTAQPQQGTFHFDGLHTGEYFLRMRPAKDWVVKSVMWNGQDYTHRPFDAAASSAFAGVVVTMTNRVATVIGAVKETSAAVILFPSDQTLWSNYGFNPPLMKSVFTAKDGSFRFEGLPAGDYFVVAVDPSDRLAWLEAGFFNRVTPLATRVSLGWGETEVTSLSIVQVRR